MLRLAPRRAPEGIRCCRRALDCRRFSSVCSRQSQVVALDFAVGGLWATVDVAVVRPQGAAGAFVPLSSLRALDYPNGRLCAYPIT